MRRGAFGGTALCSKTMMRGWGVSAKRAEPASAPPGS
jgi:hypothetical protein